MPRSRHAPFHRRGPGSGIGAGAGALRRRRRRPAGLLPELSMYVPPSLEIEESDRLGPDESALLAGRARAEQPVTATGEITEPVVRGQLLAESASLSLEEEPALLSLEEESASLSLEQESTSLSLRESTDSLSIELAPAVEAPRPEPSVEEATERRPRGRLLPAALRLGDLRLPVPSPMALPSRVLPGDWAMVEVESTPSGGVSAAVADDVQRAPAEEEELDLLPEEQLVIDDDDLGDMLSLVEPEDDLTELTELPQFVTDAGHEQDGEKDLQLSVEDPGSGPMRAVRGEPLPRPDSVDEESPVELSDPGGDIAGPEAWDDDDVPTRVEHPDQLAAALRVLMQEPVPDPLTMGVVDGGAPPSEDDLAQDGVSLDLDTESIEIPSVDLILDAPMESRADPDVMADLIGQTPSGPGMLPEDDLTEPAASQGPVWIGLRVGLGQAPSYPSGLFLETVDPVSGGSSDPVPVVGPESPPLPIAPPAPAPEARPSEATTLHAKSHSAPDPPPAPRSPDPSGEEVLAEAAGDSLEIELAEDDSHLPPLDERPPEETAGDGDSVDELLILEDEDAGPASVTFEMEKEEAADLLAEGGAIRVELGLGDKPAASPEEARHGVAVPPPRPLRRWDGRSGESGERATDLVALARLQQKSGLAAIARPSASSPAVADDSPEPEESGDDWLADLKDGEAASRPSASPARDKGDPMSPYYEDTMPGWLPGDAAGSTRGAPRPETTDISPKGRAGSRSKKKR